MELQAARRIIDTLAQGIHPVTGEVMPEDSPYNALPVVRALLTVSQALKSGEAGAAPARRQPPPNAGKPWTPQDDDKLESAFAAGFDPRDIAQEMGRTTWAVEARLARLGKIPPKVGMRIAAPLATG